MPGYGLFAGFGSWCHVRCPLAIGCAICLSIITGLPNSIEAVYSTCNAQLSYFKDISELGSSGLTQAEQTLDAVQYENETTSHFTGIALLTTSSRQSLLTAEGTLRLARPSYRLCSIQTGVARYSCVPCLAGTHIGACRRDDESHGPEVDRRRRHSVLPVCAALHLPVRHLHPFPSNVLLATHGGAFGQSFLSNLSFFYCKGSPCVKLWPANQSFAVCNRCHPSWIAVENAPLPHRMRDGSKVSIFTVPVHLYAVISPADDPRTSKQIVSSIYFHVLRLKLE